LTFKLGEFGLGFRRSYLDMENAAETHLLTRRFSINTLNKNLDATTLIRELKVNIR